MKVKILISCLFIVILLFTGCSSQPPSTDKSPNSEDGIKSQELVSSPSMLEYETKRSYSLEEIESFFQMKRPDIIKLFGNKYSEGTLMIEECHIPLNALMYEDRLTFFGLMDDSSSPTRIECADGVEIMGVKNGMNFDQIQKVLGKKEVTKTWIATEDSTAYEMTYNYGKVDLLVLSYNEDGSHAYLAFSEGEVETTKQVEEEPEKTMILNKVLTAIKNKDLKSFQKLVSPEGITVVRTFISGNGTRGKDIVMKAKANEIDMGITFPVEGETPIDLSILFTQSCASDMKGLPEESLSGTDFNLKSIASTSQVWELCGGIADKIKDKDWKPHITSINSNQFVLFEGGDVDSTGIGGWIVFEKNNGEFYVTGVFDLR